MEYSIQQKKGQIEEMQQKNWNLRLNYQSPSQNFDRNKVFGRVF